MQSSLRQTVLKSKDILSGDFTILLGHTVPVMGSDQPASEFKRLFVARTKLARERAGKSQEEMAADLGVSQGTYHKYEKRTPLPHSLVLPFCTLCRITPEWLYTAAVELSAAEPRRRRQKRVAKAA
jgi:DNA-binding XRE family transcriptional regulator